MKIKTYTKTNGTKNIDKGNMNQAQRSTFCQMENAVAVSGNQEWLIDIYTRALTQYGYDRQDVAQAITEIS